MAGFDAIAEAFVRLRPKTSDDFESEGKSQISGAVGRIAEDAALVFASKKIFDVGKAGLEELKLATTVDTQTAIELRNLGSSATVTKGQIHDLGQQMLDLAGFDDEAARSAANVLLRFGAIHDNETLTRAEKDAADLAVTMGTTLPDAAQTLGLAIQNPEQGLRRLRPAIGTLTDEQKASIKAFEDQGDAAGALNVVLDAVESKVGGAAKAYGETLPAELQRAHEEITNAKAALVTGLTPALALGANAATFMAEKFQQQPAILQNFESGLLLVGGGVGALLRPAADLAKVLDTLAARRAASAAAAAEVAAADTAGAAAATRLATATEAAAVAEGEAAAASGGLLAALGPLAIAAAATVAAYEGLANAQVHSIDTQKLLGDSTADLTRAYALANATGGGSDFIDKLVQSGDAGVGKLQQLRDAMAAAGQDTSALDTALAGAKTSQDNLNTATSEGQQVLGETPATLAAAKAAADSYSESLKTQRTAIDQLKQGYDGALSAQNALVDAQLGAQGSDLARRDAIARQAEAQQKLNDAQSGTAADTQKIRDAQLAAAQAQKDYNDAVAKGDTLKAEEAQNRLEKARQAEADASGSGPDPDKVAQAQRDLEKANLDVERAVSSEAKAHADAAEATDKAAGKTHGAAQTARDYYDRLRELSNTGIPEVDTALQGLIGQLEGASKDYQGKLQYDLTINGYTLNPTEVQALLDAGLGISIESLRKQEQKDRGDYQTGGSFASGGYAPAGMAFGHGEEGWELAVLGQGVSKLDKDAFVIDHQRSMALMAGAGTSGDSVTVNIHAESWSNQRTIAELVNTLRAEAFLKAGAG